MNEIFQALFEGSLLSKVGMSALDMVRSLKTLHRNSEHVFLLFEDLEKAGMTPKADRVPLVGSFQKRVPDNQDYLIAVTFSEMALVTGQLEVYWKDAACLYLLKKKLSRKEPSQIDIDYAANMMSFFKQHHPFRNFCLDFSDDLSWKNEIVQEPKNSIHADRWLRQFAFFPTTLPFALKDLLLKELERTGQESLLTQYEAEWCHYIQTQRLLT